MGAIHIIDDDDACREVMADIVRVFGFSARDFCSGDNYLLHMQQATYTKPTAIFSDMHMNGLSGLATLQEVQRYHPDIPCYLISGNTIQLKQIDLSAYIIMEILEKPISINKIGAILNSLQVRKI